MMHLAAFTSSISNAAALQQISALKDGLLQIRDNALIVPDQMTRLIKVFAFGTNLTRAQLQPPSLANLGKYEIKPFANAMAGAGARTPELALLFDALKLVGGEELPAFATQGSAGAQQAYAGVLFADAEKADFQGDMITLRAGGTDTLTANAWSDVTLSFDSVLPEKTFHVYGARMKSAGALLFRFVHQESNNRPGGVAVQSDLASDPEAQRRGGMGRWFGFTSRNLPTLQVLSTSADTVETLELDVIAA